MIKIFVINDISPEFIEPQRASFRKYLQEPFEYTICGGLDLARKPDKASEIEMLTWALSIPRIKVQRDERVMEMCKEFGLEHSPGPNETIFLNGRYRDNIHASYATQWVWQEVISKQQGIVLFCHSDVFLTEPICLSDCLRGYEMCSTLKRRAKANADGITLCEPLTYLTHLWEPFMLLDMDAILSPWEMNWWGGRIDNTWMPDGGGTYLYLQAHPELRVRELAQWDCDDDKSLDFHPSMYSWFSLYGKKILHYSAGCRWATDEWGWNGQAQMDADEYHRRKLAWVRKVVGV